MNNNFIKKLNQQFETKSQSKVMQYSCFPWKSRLSVEVSTHPKVKKHCSKNWKPMHCVFGEYDGVPSPRQSQQLQRLVLGKNDGMLWTKAKDKDGKDVTEEFLKMHIPQKNTYGAWRLHIFKAYYYATISRRRRCRSIQCITGRHPCFRC